MNTFAPLINAWVGRGNFGDELLSYGLRLDLGKVATVPCATYYQPGGHPIFTAAGEGMRIATHGGRLPVRLARLLPFLDRLSPYDGLLFGGGSVLHSARGLERKSGLVERYRLARGRRPALAGCIGVSVGPFDTAADERAFADFADRLDFIVCRDRSSVDIAASLCRNPRILFGCDLAYGAWAQHSTLFARDAEEGLVGVSFLLDRRKPQPYRETALANMTALVDRLTAGGGRVRLIALYIGEKYQDHLLHRQLLGLARHPERITLHDYAGDVFATIQAIATCSHYLSMRLHGAICAALCDIPFLALNRSQKLVDFCADARDAGHVADFPDISGDRDALLAAADRLLALPPRGAGGDSRTAIHARGFGHLRDLLGAAPVPVTP